MARVRKPLGERPGNRGALFPVASHRDVVFNSEVLRVLMHEPGRCDVYVMINGP